MKGNQNGLDNGGDMGKINWWRSSADSAIHFEHWVSLSVLYCTVLNSNAYDGT